MAHPYYNFKPDHLWLDNNNEHINAHGGGVLFHDGTYYWFGEHKIAGEAGNVAHVGVHVYSSTDLYNWTDEGIALPVVNDDPDHPLTAGCIIERPKVIHNANTGKFVMWFHHELKDYGYRAALCGIAVSDTPTGPYTYVRSFRPNQGVWPINVQDFHKEPVRPEVMETYYGGAALPDHPDSLNLLGRGYLEGQMSRDMTLFVDDDGTAYHIYSSEFNSTTHIAELTDDYLDHTGKFARAFVGRWMEAPTLFKHQGKYHFIASGCTGWKPNAARYAVATSIFGPWMERDNPCTGHDDYRTFCGQGTFVLPVAGNPDAFIFMADRWTPENAINGRYLWLPIEFDHHPDGCETIKVVWHNEWDLDVFGNAVQAAQTTTLQTIEPGG